MEPAFAFVFRHTDGTLSCPSPQECLGRHFMHARMTIMPKVTMQCCLGSLRCHDFEMRLYWYQINKVTILSVISISIYIGISVLLMDRRAGGPGWSAQRKLSR